MSATARLRILVTGIVEWEDPDTGQVTTEKMPWRSRWAVAGVHSYRWQWVRRYGKRECGCTVNPLTRRRVLTDIGCQQHGWMYYVV